MKGAWAGIEVAAVLALFWFAGLYLLAVACRLAETRTEVTFRGPFVFVTRADRWGTSCCRWRRADIREFVVERRGLSRKNEPPYPHVRIRFTSDLRAIGILFGRPKGELAWIADKLTGALKQANQRDPTASPDVWDQPLESRAVLTRGAESLMLELPALGFRGGIAVVTLGGLLGGLFLFAGAWAVVSGSEHPWVWPTCLGICLPGLLGLLAIGVALEALGCGFRRTVLTVAGNRFTLQETMWQGAIRKRAWPRSEIAALDVDSSAVPRLTLHLATRRRKSLLLYRTEDELLWIATLLREALQKPSLPKS